MKKESFMKSDILHAMNDIDDKYIMEAAQCLQSKKRRHTHLYRFALSAAALLIIVIIATKTNPVRARYLPIIGSIFDHFKSPSSDSNTDSNTNDDSPVRGYDTIVKTDTSTFHDTLSCQSIFSSEITEDMLTDEQKEVSFDITLTGTLNYDKLSGEYLSSSSTVALDYDHTGPVTLLLNAVSTGTVERDQYVLVTCSADLVGTTEVNGQVVTINYGSIYYTFQISKE